MPAIKLSIKQSTNKMYHVPVCIKIQVCYTVLTILHTHLHGYPCHYCWQNGRQYFKYADNNRCIVGNE